MLQTKLTYKRPSVDYKKVRKGQVVPDQSMSIREIVKRFVRGIPVDVLQRPGVFIDQNDHDLEQLSRMEFGDKAAMADELHAHAREIHADQLEKERMQRETKQAEEAEKLEAEKGAKQPGIVAT